MAALGVAFGKGISGPLTTVYWEGTKDIEIDLFEQAAARIRLADRMFPRIARIRSAVDEIQAERYGLKQLASGQTTEAPTTYCGDCEDTGLKKHLCTEWEPCKWCRAKGEPSCGDRYRTRCACVGHNPVIKARRDAARGKRKYAYPSDQHYSRQGQDRV